MNIKLYSLISLFISICWCSIAQNNAFQFLNLNANMGLSEGVVICTFQDHRGFIWEGTAHGLNKYDGSNFTTYNRIIDDTNSLSNNYISCIYEDSEQNLWIATKSGLCIYNRDFDQFTRIPYSYKKESHYNGMVKAFYEDENKQLWIVGNAGIQTIDKELKRINSPLKNIIPDLEDSFCHNIFKDRDNNLCFTFSWGLLKYNPITSEIIKYNNENKKHRLSGKNIFCSMLERNGDIWIGYEDNGFDIIQYQSDKLSHYEYEKGNPKSLSNNFVKCFTQLDNGDVFIGTDDKLNIFNPNSQDFTRISSQDGTGSITTNIIQHLYVSGDGTLWVACRGGGVCFSNSYLNRFNTYRAQPGKPNSLAGNTAISFTEDTNHYIWIATDGEGISRFNPIDQNFKTFKHKPNNYNSISNNKALTITCDTTNNLWVGFWQGGLNHFKIINNELKLQKKYPSLNSHNPNVNSITSLYRDPIGTLWVGTHKYGAFFYNPEGDRFEALKLIPNSEEPDLSILDILCDNENNMWFTTENNGLFYYNPKTKEQINFTPNPKTINSLPSSTVNSIYQDSKQHIWVATNEGISLFNKENFTFQTFRKQDGLPSNQIFTILEDNNGDFWLSTSRGLSRMSLQLKNDACSASFRNFDIKDGLQDNYFNHRARFKDSYGQLYFGGYKGFNVFNPEKIIDNETIPPIYLTDFLLYNKKVAIGAESPLKKHISETNEIVLNYKQSVFTIKYTAINYLYGNKNQYAFKLDNFEDTWNYVGNQKMATYTNLPPGKYVFNVKASNNDGVWNQTGLSLNIKILPPWWLTWWFKIGATLIILIAILSFYFYRINTLKKQKVELEKNVQERTVDLKRKAKELTEKQEQITQQNSELNEQKEELETTLLSLQETQTQLIQSEKMASLGILTAGIAHEIYNPLNFIQGGNYALNSYLEENLSEHKQEIKPFSDAINLGIKRVSTIIESLNHFNRKSEKLNEKCNLQLIMDNCLIMISHQTNNHATIEKQYIDTLPTIEGNESEIHQVFLNVLINASQAISKDGTIRITFKHTNNIIAAEIEDNGYGIAKEDLSKVTVPFFTTKDPGAGTGLGMSIAYTIMKKHKGSIQYDSEPGKGTIVRLHFPA